MAKAKNMVSNPTTDGSQVVPTDRTVEDLAAENASLREALKNAQSEGGPDVEDITPAKWVNLVNQILGPDFSCERVEPDTGGTLFKIIVPRKKSNANPIHWEMHNRDVRTKNIGNTGIEGVKDWCLKVRANLLASEIQLIKYP